MSVCVQALPSLHELPVSGVTVQLEVPLHVRVLHWSLVHVKDLTSIPPITAGGKQDFGDSMKEMTEVGSGVIDWKRIFAQSDKAGIKHYFVEHDNPKSPFESIKTSYQYLAQLRF